MTRLADIPATTRLRALTPRPGWIVKSAVEDVWSGYGDGDPDNPALGHECVDSVDKAKVFYDRAEAEDEADTYNCGAYVLGVGGAP